MLYQENIKESTPKYWVGRVIPIRFSENSMPSRIKIMQAMMDLKGKWAYYVLLEHTNKMSWVSEEWIDKRISNRTAPVYHIDEIMMLVDDGFMWLGNYTTKTAIEKSQKLIQSSKVVEMVMCIPARNQMGDLVEGKYGIWIRYKN